MASFVLKNAFRGNNILGKEGFKLLELLSKNCPQNQPRRYLNVHEHISYTLLREAGICVPEFGVATNAKEAGKIACKLRTDELVVKAQVLTGGRGKGTFKNGFKGGVKMAGCKEEVEEIAGKMIGQKLVTKQTGPEGKICNKVMVTVRKPAKKEYYFAIMLERAFNGPVVIASSQGGVDIEEVAEKSPDAIVYEPINVCKGLGKEQAASVADRVDLEDKRSEIAEMLMNMYDLFVSKDALLVEINPYVRDCDNNFFALDAKLNFDDNASFRQKELFKLQDFTQIDMKEVEAAKFHLNYIALDGSIGCMVNGAGLAMATLDIITLHKGSPANFLDVGGGATAEAVKEAFKIITSDKKVKTILVNIFGGIMRCDIIAQGIVAATKELSLKVPIVCRLQGTNAEKAKKIIKDSKMKITPEDDLDKASKIAVKLAGGSVPSRKK